MRVARILVHCGAMSTKRCPVATNRCVLAMCWCALLWAAPVSAEICKYLDADGNMHYTNVAPEKGWKKLSCGVGEEAARGGGGNTRTPTPSGSTPDSSPASTPFMLRAPRHAFWPPSSC